MIRIMALASLVSLGTGCSQKGALVFSTDNSSQTAFSSLRCDPAARLTATDTRRLTKTEIENTLRDLLPASAFGSLAGYISQLPEENTAKSISSFEPQFTNLHLEVFTNLAYQAATAITQSDAVLNGLLSQNSSCSNFTTATAACVREFISRFGLKVMRRPVPTSDVDWLMTAFNFETAARDRFNSLLLVLLQVPELYYHIELGTAQGTDTEFDLSAYEIASRLSYTLWDTMPNDALLAQAASGALLDPAGLETAVDGMIADSRTRAKFDRFIDYWLHTVNLPNFTNNPAFISGVDTNGLKTEMVRELKQFVDDVVWQKGKGYKELLTSKVSFARTPALAQIYEHALSATPNNGGQVLGAGRRGLLLRGPILMSGDDENHPILRGSLIRQNILCDPLGMPDPNALGQSPELDTPPYIVQYTTRERVTLKTSPGQCQGCHGPINSLGFALEEFDSLGRRRTFETNYAADNSVIATHPIDPVVRELRIEPAGPDSSSSAEELVNLIANSDKGPSCFARQTFRYFKMQNENVTGDGCVLTGVRDAIRGDSGSIVRGLKKLLVHEYVGKKVVK